MGYHQTTLIEDGTLMEEHQFTDQELRRWFRATAAASRHLNVGVVWEVHTLWHDHPKDQDCECAQFATDHKPIWTNRTEK